jgi:hypothetical protein
MTYRSKFIDHLKFVKELLNNDVFNLNNFTKVLTHFVLLTKLACKEIEDDKTIINKNAVIINYGLDYYEVFFNKLIKYASLHITIDEIEQIVFDINKIDYLHKTKI